MADAPVNLGLIGLGPWWETRYRPALTKLDQRWKVTVVCDDVLARADQAARDLSARAVCGVTAMTARDDVQGLLWLAAGWPGTTISQILRAGTKPVLIAPGIDLPATELSSLCDAPPFVAAFPRRCTPVSLRLQELMATQLGRATRIEVSVAMPESPSMQFATSADLAGSPTRPRDDLLLDWVDWSLYLFRAEPTQVVKQIQPQSFTLEFAPLDDGPTTGMPRLAEITERTEPGAPEVQVSCERGSAILRDATTMEWTLDEGLQTETLSAERSGIEVMLDHFCRRIAGSLLPMPDLHDVIRSRRIVNVQ